MRPLDEFRVVLMRMRTRVLVQQRALAKVAHVASDRTLLDLAAVAGILRIHPEVARERMAAGQIRGAHLDEGAWRVRTCDLLAYVQRELAGRADLNAADFFEKQVKGA